MKFLILNADYPEFLRTLYSENEGLKLQPYEEQLRLRNESLFGVADFYSSNLRRLGHEAYDIHVNNGWMQRAWARENGFPVPEATRLGLRMRKVCQGARSLAAGTPLRHFKGLISPLLHWLDNHQIIAAQIQKYKPDVILNQVMGDISCRFLREIKPYVRLIVGNHAATRLPVATDWRCYDLVVSSFPPTLDWFRERGLRTELHRLAFEPRVLNHLKIDRAQIGVSFVGNLFQVHDARTGLLEHLSRRVNLKVWGPGIEHLHPRSPIRQCYMGPAWGRDMYQTLRDSKITINHHGSISPYANNMRLFEATGVGTLLLTDAKKNLQEMFNPGQEVIAYHTAEECAEMIDYYLGQEGERVAIAHAGQSRTLSDHTYYKRMQELGAIVGQHLAQSKSRRPTVSLAAEVPRDYKMHMQPSISLPSAAIAITRAVVKKTPLNRLLRAARSRLGHRSISCGHKAISPSDLNAELIAGWQDPKIPSQQRRLVDTELSRMYRGDVIPVYRIAAEAVRATQLEDPSIIEVGCASGYYSEVLSYLLGRRLRYTGVDYSRDLIRQSKQYYPKVPFMLADATALPLADQCCDIVFSSALIMHVPAYESAVRESLRVSRLWCIFHRTPVIKTKPTTYFSKFAYGVPVVELIFNEDELLDLLQKLGAEPVKIFYVGDSLVTELGEPVSIKTYVFRKRR